MAKRKKPHLADVSIAVPLSPIHIEMPKGEILKIKDRWDRAMAKGDPVPSKVSYPGRRDSEIRPVSYPPRKATPPGRPIHPLEAKVRADIRLRPEIPDPQRAKNLATRYGIKISRSTVRNIRLAT